MHRTSSLSWQITALVLITLALGLMLLPEDLSGPVRRTARDLSRPGQTLTKYFSDRSRDVWQTVQSWQARRTDLLQLTADLTLERQRNAEFQQRIAMLQQDVNVAEVKRNEKVSANSSNPLFVPNLIEARVLGRETVALHAGRKILGAGSAKGIGENLLVIDSQYPTLDAGKDQGLTIHSPVYAGHLVVGRTINCGGYSCLLQPVTDAKFSGSAQLMRRTATGLQAGPEGVVEGTGQKHCRLTGIWRREAVEVGDEIYTPADDPLIPFPMYYGRVIRADLPEGTAHWNIEIEPAANERRLKQVQILKPTENPVRIMAN